ncbi:Immunoglobulin domain protein [Paragonimus heterotremus]|uniref:Immunoglobulin domain protein n=1 Tax=Paragonimus heterotremus TaxID=100268 RepID=A0A8J4WLJ2_9TREM|nr:Immunoglobulin domain protein [Paragonimus heterotremus]
MREFFLHTVQISTPPLVLLGHPFNLTCSVQLNQNNGVHMSVDWFRPEHSYDGQAHPNAHYPAGNLPDKIQTVWPHLHKGPPTDVNRSAVVRWFAQSFVQLTSRPAFGNTVFKQLRTDQKFNYYSEVIFATTKATTMDAGFYECRAYEPNNQGQERVLDRAIINIVVHKPYPNKPLDHPDWANKFGYLLADYWQMLSERQLAVHEQQIQNDGDVRLREPALPLSDLENFGE